MNGWLLTMWVLISTLVILIVMVVINALTYKHKFIVRKITSAKDIVIIDKFKIYSKQGKAEKFILKKTKKKAPVAPDSAIDYTKGLFGPVYIVEAWLDENGVFTYIKTTTTVKKTDWSEQDKITEGHKCLFGNCDSTDVNKDVLGKYWCKEHWADHAAALGERDPITTDDKDFYAQEVADAHKYDTENWKKDLPIYISLGLFSMILICGMIFGPDLLQEYQNVLSGHVAITGRQAEITADLKEIILERQTIGGTPDTVKPPI